jgi:hypothetical protein
MDFIDLRAACEDVDTVLIRVIVPQNDRPFPHTLHPLVEDDQPAIRFFTPQQVLEEGPLEMENSSGSTNLKYIFSSREGGETSVLPYSLVQHSGC